MGFFDSFSEGFNAGRERARNEAYRRKETTNSPVKLVEPSSGRIVELQVTEQDEFAANIYMGQLEIYAKCMEQYGVQSMVTGKKVRLTFPNGIMAENTRKTWRK